MEYYSVSKRNKLLIHNTPQMNLKNNILSRAWWLVLVIPAIGRLRHEDCSKFETSLGYKVSSRPTRTA